MDFFPEDITLTQAAEMQKDLAEELVLNDDFPIDIKTVGGVALHSRGNSITSSLVLLKSEDSFNTFEEVESETLMEITQFPAVPTFEGFREGKVLHDLINRTQRPDVLIINGHGLDHPRGFGLACHVGFSLDLPTISVSQNLLAGEVSREYGREEVLLDGKLVGLVYRGGPIRAPIYVSSGYKITLDTALDIVVKTTKNKLPEPLYLARKALVEKIMSNTQDL